MDTQQLLNPAATKIDLSGIRRVFRYAATLTDPINLSIGQPDFPVPQIASDAACEAIRNGVNGYTQTQGHPLLLRKIADWLKVDLGWTTTPFGQDDTEPTHHIVTAGTSGALTLLFHSLLGPGDECIIPDPYFVSYPHLATLAGAKAVTCDTYPDFNLTAERVAPLITDRTKFVLMNTPSNPSGVVATEKDCKELLELCRSRNVLLVTDEIYDEFCFPEALTAQAAGDDSIARCPSPARLPGAEDSVLLIRGFGKTYGCTGWRLGYAAGPAPIIDQMAKIQQYTFVCAPAPLQAGAAACFDADMTEQIADYERRRDMVLSRLGPLTSVANPGGAFYAFFDVAESLGLTATDFVDRGLERSLLTIPGNCFSERDTHVRLSYATKPDQLARGLDIIESLFNET